MEQILKILNELKETKTAQNVIPLYLTALLFACAIRSQMVNYYI